MTTCIRSFVLSCLFLLPAAIGQDLDDVTIAGRITDSNGLPIAGATVTASHVGSKTERTVVSNDEGVYRLIELRPGTYKLKAGAEGFGQKETADLQTLSGQNVRLDITLAPAALTATATVHMGNDDIPVVDTTRTVVGGTVTARQIEELPNNTRNPFDLVLTLGGTSEEQLSTSGLAEDRYQSPPTAPLEQGNFSLSGGVGYSNNLTIDGLDNNDDRSSRDRFQPPLDAIEEVQVITNQFSSEYGRASGGRINLRTKAGGSGFRGRIFAYFRDDNLNANSWYNNSRVPAVGRQPLTEYNPGFTLSGPFWKSRSFFSAAYERIQLLDSTFIDTWVPAAGNPRFALPAPTNQSCPPEYAACTDASSSTATPILPYQRTLSTPNVSNSLTARIDHSLSDANNFTFGFQFGRRRNQRTTAASTTRLDQALQVRNLKSEAYNFTDNHVFGSNAVNQIRGQYSVYRPSFETDDALAPVVLIGYTNPGGGARTLIAGNSTAPITGDASGFPQNRRETRIQIQDSFSYVTGRHSLKFGLDLMKVRSEALGLEDATGTFNFSSMLNFQSNVMSRYRQNFGTGSDVRNTYAALFVNDEFRIRPNLTLSMGLRFERETAVDDYNLGPRLGVAWDPTNKGRTVLRFGAGVFYNRVLLRTVADSIQNAGGNLVEFDTSLIGTSANDSRRVAILAAIANRFPESFGSVEDIRQLLTEVCPTIPSPPAPCTTSTGFANSVTSTGNPLRSVEPNIVIPESYQFNVGFEREIARGWILEANYTLSKTVHLWRDRNGNAPVLPSGFPDWTAWLVANPFVLSPTRRYTFFLGAPNDANGTHAESETGGNCSTTTVNCFVNLNTLNSSSSTPLVSQPGINGNATGAPIGIALAAIARFRPNPTVGETSVIGSNGNSFYRGLVIELRTTTRRLGLGFGSAFRFNYTLSKTMDDGLNNTSNAEVNGDFGLEWARTLQDRRHRIAFSGVFDTPWWLGRLIISPLVRWGSSSPFNLGNGGSDRNLDDLSTDRLNYSGNLADIVWRRPGSDPPPDSYIAQFTLAPIGARGGNLPRNAGRGPSFYTFDLSVSREWKFGSRFRVKPVVQFDNILNAAVFNFGAAFIDFNGLTVTSGAARSNFLVPTRTYRQRQIRLGMRLDF